MFKRLICSAALFFVAYTTYARVPVTEINLPLAAEILSENNARLFDGAEVRTVPLNLGDTEINVSWKMSTGDEWPMLRAALELYTWPTMMLQSVQSRTVTDPVIDGVTYNGTWRQALIRRVRQPRGESYEYWVVLTLRAGYASSIAWDEARFTEGVWSESTTNDVSTNNVNIVTNTASFDTQRHVKLRWENINPFKIQACLASLNQETYTNQTVYTETLDGVWYNIMVSGGKADDGSGFVEMILSQQRFTMQLYEYYGTPRQGNIYKLWNVPKPLAQTIIDDWQGEGRSADASYNESTKLVTIVLRDDQVNPDNLSTGLIKDGCDKYIQMHFAWGYTKSNLVAWIDTHDGIDVADTEPTSRRISITERQDGLFNGLIEERTFSALSVSAPQYTITLPTGTKITRQTEYGYNWNNAQMSAVSNYVYLTYDNASTNAVGRTVDFRVTREDDCSFDWVAVITYQSEDILGDVTTGTAGVHSTAWSMRGATAAEVDALEASIKSGTRTNVSVQISMRDDELADVQATKTVVQAGEGTYDSGTNGVRSQLYYGGNADEAATNALSAPRTSVSPNIRVNDDGTVSYAVSMLTVQETTGSTSSAGTGVINEIYFGRNADAYPSVSSAPRVDVRQSINPQDDGTYSYSISRTTVQETTGSVSSAGTGIIQELYYAANADSVPAVTSTRLKQVSQSIRPQDDGTYGYAISTTTVQENTNTWNVGTKGATVADSVGRNVASLTDPGITSTSTVGRSVELSLIGYDDAGNLQYRMRDIQRNSQSNQVAFGTHAQDIVLTAVTGDSSAPSDQTPSQGTSYVISMSQNVDGTVDWTQQQIDSAALSSSTTMAVLKPAWRAGGYTSTVTVFRNQTSIPSPGGTYYQFTSLRINDDGTFDGMYEVITYDEETFFTSVTTQTNLYIVSDVDYTWKKTGVPGAYINQSMYRIIQHNAADLITKDYDTARAWTAGGLRNGSGVQLLQLNGVYYWHATRVDPVPVCGNWTDAGDTFETPR